MTIKSKKQDRAIELLEEIDAVFGYKPNKTHGWLSTNSFGSVGTFENFRKRRTNPYDSSITALERALHKAKVEHSRSKISSDQLYSDAVDALRQIRNLGEDKLRPVAEQLIMVASIIRAHQNRDDVLRSFGLNPQDVPVQDPEIDRLLAGLSHIEDDKDNHQGKTREVPL